MFSHEAPFGVKLTRADASEIGPSGEGGGSHAP
jgi:hypothetical protein